jgi:hypothetical protein
MALTKIPLNTEYLSLYVEGDKGMVFHHTKKSLYQLPALSIALFIAIDEGFDQQEATQEVAQSSQIPAEKLIDTFEKILTIFCPEKENVSYLDGRYPELSSALERGKFKPERSAHKFQIANAAFAINTKSEALSNEINLLLQRVKVELDVVDFEIFIKYEGNAFNIYANEHLVEENLQYEEVLPLIIDRLQILSFQKSNYYYCFHGAALQTPHGNLLLPGTSGAGKSTLSAILSDSENKLYSDEIIALDPNFELSTLNLPIAIKSGSWDILNERYPELKQVTTWSRLDGRMLKYVWPPACVSKRVEDVPHHRKYLLVNPHFGKIKNENLFNQQKNAVQELGTIDTIAMLTGSGYQLGIELNEDKLEKLIDFIDRIPCYRLSYSTSEQARQQLALLWQTQ